MAARFCQQLGAKHLILTHFSQRYGSSDPSGENGVDKLVLEAKEVLGDNNMVTVSAAEDFKTFSIPVNR